MDHVSPLQSAQYLTLAEDRRQALAVAADAYRLARLAQRNDLSALQRARLGLGRSLMALGRRIAAGLDERHERRPLTQAR